MASPVARWLVLDAWLLRLWCGAAMVAVAVPVVGPLGDRCRPWRSTPER
jgi:hypothetical protein